MIVPPAGDRSAASFGPSAMSGRSSSSTLAPAPASVAACARPSAPSPPVRRTTRSFSSVIAISSQSAAHLVDRGVLDALVEHDLAARHRHHAVAAFEDVVHVVADEDAGHALLLQPAHEADHLL